MSKPRKKSVKPDKLKNIARAKRGNLKARADGFGGTGSGIYSQFEAAKFSNKRQYVWSPWPADFKKVMTTFDRQELTRKVRWLSVNSGLVREIVNSYCMYAVGDGIKVQPASGNPAWDAKAAKYFEDWASRPCELTGRYNWHEVQQLVCRKIDVDGEIFVLKTYGQNSFPLLQLIESHRVGMSNGMPDPAGAFDGVIFNKYSRVIGYNVIRSDGTARVVSANAIMHVHNPEQVTGARAYSPLVSAINGIIDVLELLSLEKVAAKSNADIVRTITRDNGGQFDTGDFEAFGMRPQDYPNGVYNNPEQIGSFVGGKVLALAPGEKLESFESKRPNQLFSGFIDFNNRDSCMGSGLPWEFVCNPSAAGGAAMRFIVAKAERAFSNRQNILINHLCVPTWGYVIGNAIANGELEPNENWHRVNWVTPRRVSVDAGREAAANQKDLEQGIKTYSDDFAERGMSYATEVDRRGADARLAIDAAKKWNVPLWMITKPSNTPNADIDSASQDAVGPEPDKEFTPFPSAGNP
jgi:lambda family phage portal protein